jgi:hypothetical protein
MRARVGFRGESGSRLQGFVNILRRSVDAAMTPHEVRPIRTKNFFRKGFLLCGRHIRTSLSPPSRHPWGSVASAARRLPVRLNPFLIV